VTIGAGLIAVYGAMKDPAHSIDELLELFFKTRFLVWMFMQAVIVCGLLLAARLSVYLRPRHKHTTRMKMFRGVIYGCVRFYLLSS
jgi:magnesium transporter